MATLDVPRVIRRVRERLGLSQEGLSRRLNATKGAIQHWERGRNQPDLARLFLLRSICPPGAERKEVEALIRQAQENVAGATEGGAHGARMKRGAPDRGSQMLQRENARLRQQIARLQGAVDRRAEQLRILEDLATDLQRQVAGLKNADKSRMEPVGSDSTARG
ncbi:MAG TPA: helix-turn-helix domain-containing protein [Terriglobia bacterium]|nr:helix-turn-helix domain-containing protein [Terriglobia bacterium]